VGIDPKRLYVTVFAGDEALGIPRDDEAVLLWQSLFAGVGIDAAVGHMGSEASGAERGMRTGERVFFYDAKKNWWSRAGVPSAMPAGEPGGPTQRFSMSLTWSMIRPMASTVIPIVTVAGSWR